jgi:transcriptional regulator with XRE-family HTH domain
MFDGLSFRHGDIIAAPILKSNRHSDIFSRHAYDMRDLGQRLRHVRKLRGLTQVQLAKLARVQQSSVSELETGETKEISGPTLIALANALNVRPQWLLDSSGGMEPNAADLDLSTREIDLILALRERETMAETAVDVPDVAKIRRRSPTPVRLVTPHRKKPEM